MGRKICAGRERYPAGGPKAHPSPGAHGPRTPRFTGFSGADDDRTEASLTKGGGGPLGAVREGGSRLRRG
jgi:hypothetical protein